MIWLFLLTLSAHSAAPCGPPERLTTEAMLGLLDPSTVACLQTSLHADPRSEAEHSWRLLLVDALAKGKHRLWRQRLQEREAWRATLDAPPIESTRIEDLDCSDVDVYMNNIRACHVRAKARQFREALGAEDPQLTNKDAVDLHACADVAEVAAAAKEGALSGAQTRCLMHHLRTIDDEGVEQAIVMILIEDALARGGDDRVDALMGQLLYSLDCGDPQVYLEHEESCDLLHDRLTSPDPEDSAPADE